MTSNVSKPGFTLFEVLVTLAIATLVLTLSFPFFGPLMSKPKLDAISYRVMTLFEGERVAAWRDGTPSTIDLSPDYRDIIVRRTGAVFKLPSAVQLATSPAMSCASSPTVIIFYPDGHACAPRIQILRDKVMNEIQTNSMTGALTLVR